MGSGEWESYFPIPHSPFPIPHSLLFLRRRRAQPLKGLLDLLPDVFVLLGLEQILQRPDRATITKGAERDDHSRSNTVTGGAIENRQQRFDRAFVSQIAERHRRVGAHHM